MEARSVATELAALGARVDLAPFDESLLAGPPQGPLLLRLSDPVMREAANALTHASIPYFGPGAAALERCYDKYEATRSAAAAGIACPRTRLAAAGGAIEPPAVLKPRRGSDSLGLRVLRRPSVPSRARNEDWIVQPLVLGTEITVAALRGHVGEPLHIALPEGTPYSFARKYLATTPREPVADRALAHRVREEARKTVNVLGADWAVRIDWIHERSSGKLLLLECDAAPLVGRRSAFAHSLSAAGIGRVAQLRLLLAA